jgi:hypothetical protein
MRKQLVKAGKKWRMAGRLVVRRAARLTRECATALNADYLDGASRVHAVLQAGRE